MIFVYFSEVHSSEEDIKQSYSITIIICDFSCAIFAFSFREIIGRIVSILEKYWFGMEIDFKSIGNHG